MLEYAVDNAERKSGARCAEAAEYLMFSCLPSRVALVLRLWGDGFDDVPLMLSGCIKDVWYTLVGPPL